MLIALTIMLLGGGGYEFWLFPEDFSDRVEVVVTEETRRTEIIDLVDQINERAALYNDHVKEISEESAELNRDSNATADDFESIIERLHKERKQMQSELLDVRLQMAGKFIEQEWTRAFADDSSSATN